MANLIEHVKAYLDNADTDYALMVEGPWGCGKTFFWRNEIDPEIRSRKRSHQVQDLALVHGTKKRENLHPVYVSLYGITRADDIDRAVLLELNPWLGNKTMATVGTFARPLLKAFRLDPDSIRIDPKHWINLTDVVLCFDDLERCNISVSDVLGRINEYVEHEGVKTVILCNEGALRDEEVDRYWLIKEKVIGRTVKFEVDHAAVVDALIENHEVDGTYHDFLAAHRYLIIDLFRRSGWNNIRSLKHALGQLHTAVASVDEKAPYAAAARKAMIGMILPLTFEHELGEHDERLIRDIATQNPLTDVAWAISKKGEPSPSKKYEIKYFDVPPEDHPSSTAVADLITTGLLNRAVFRSELDERYAEPDELEAAVRVLYGKIWDLSDEEFMRHYNVLWKAVADRSLLTLANYYGLYLASHYWANLKLVEVDWAQTRETLAEAVRDSVARQLVEYDDDLEDHLPMVTGEVQAEVVQFREFIITENAKLRRGGDEQKSKEFLHAIKHASAEGMRKLVSDYYLVPVLDTLPVDETADAIWALPNPLKYLFRLLIQRRYLKDSPTPATTQEVAGIQRLRCALVARVGEHSGNARPLSHAAIEQIANDLAEAASRLAPPAALAVDDGELARAAEPA